MTAPGVYRHLLQNSTLEGHFCILAIDHRANLVSQLQKFHLNLTDADVIAFKRDVLHHLLPEASAVLTDPAYGMPPLIAGGLLGQAGLLAPLEVTNYSLHPRDRITQFIEGWSVEQIKGVGGTGVKLLLYYHPGDAALKADKHGLVERIIVACARFQLPFFLEPIAYSLDGAAPLSITEQRQVAVETAQTFSAMGVDILKLEFPVNPAQEPDEAVWSAACRDLNAACSVPWALLSAGVDYNTFARQARIACINGASGVIVGRAVWAEALALAGQVRIEWLMSTGRDRMREMAAICRESARDWRGRIAPPEMTSGWYMS
jgi:tagatose-1,6-bisphosphate aldolase